MNCVQINRGLITWETWRYKCLEASEEWERGTAARNSRACKGIEGMVTEYTVRLRFQIKRELLNGVYKKKGR